METDICKHIRIIIYEIFVCQNDKAIKQQMFIIENNLQIKHVASERKKNVRYLYFHLILYI
jgi:hypothetical protein